MEKIFEKYYEGTGTTEKELMDEFIKEAEKAVEIQNGTFMKLPGNRIYWNIN